MLIEINKIIDEAKKSPDGTPIIDPATQKPIKTYKVKPELIRTDEIRSARIWEKSFDMEAYIEGDVTVLYLYGNKTKDSRPEVLINENFNEFKQRTGAITI